MENIGRYSDLYFAYHSFDIHGKLKFYVEKIQNNTSLDYFEKLELSIDYTIALFEIGKYEKYLYLVDDLIEKVIEDNIRKINGVDVFETLLFKKAASHFNLKEYDLSINILRQLVKINGNEPLYKRLLSKAIRSERQLNKNGLFHPITFVVFLTALIMKVLDIFIIDAFYNQYHDQFSVIYLTLFGIGIALIVYSYIQFLHERYK
jgi:tetratricopeptide (TPR) repeat protein